MEIWPTAVLTAPLQQLRPKSAKGENGEGDDGVGQKGGGGGCGKRGQGFALTAAAFFKEGHPKLGLSPTGAKAIKANAAAVHFWPAGG